MSKYRHELPQLNGRLFITDGGIETTLIFHDGFELPHFAAFDLLNDQRGRSGLKKYFQTYAKVARDNEVGIVLESATWRASKDWGALLGYSTEDMINVNREAMRLLADVREAYETSTSPIVLSGCIGPRGDGYSSEVQMTPDEAESYHVLQVQTFSQTQADVITAITMTYPEEAIGIVRAAQRVGMPVIVSFTTETDGRLPSGHSLRDAINLVDETTDNGPAYYMINCAHPTHFAAALARGERWTRRIKGMRSNASTMSHAELDDAEELDDGNPAEFGGQHRILRDIYDHLNVFGGCCGTDHRHVDAVAKACVH